MTSQRPDRSAAGGSGPGSARAYSPLDRLLIGLQRQLPATPHAPSIEIDHSAPAKSTTSSTPAASSPANARAVSAEESRAYPARAVPEAQLDEAARRHAAGLMRINHAGEVSAQALYHGQALMARDSAVRAHLLRAADEERQHLQWCERRLTELHDAPSRLSPLWYAGSFAIGAAAGLAGDRWNLGFVEETEKQVAAHLEDHLERLPAGDSRSRAIVSAMKADEERHGEEAAQAGARALPMAVKRVMGVVARVMKFGAYRF